jgi:tetratricopeptide (TPR) repeat protein
MNKIKHLTLEEVFNIAVKNQNENKFDAATDFYNKILEIDPNHLPALNNLGIIHKILRDNQKAKDCYEKVIKIDPNHIQALNNLGTVFRELGDNQKAKIYYEKAIAIDSNYTIALNNLAQTYRLLKEHQKAKDLYNKILEIDPNHTQANISLGSIHRELGEYQKAKVHYEKIVGINPDNIAILYNLGVMARELGENKKAKDYYEKILKIDPNHAEVHNGLGVAYQGLKDEAKALIHFEKALKVNPNLVSASRNLTNIYIRELDNFDKAINSSYKALKSFRKDYTFLNQSIHLFRLKHDVQQAEYLSSKNYKIDGIDDFQKIGGEILNRKENEENENNSNKNILLNKKEIDTLLPFYKSDHIYKTKKISGSCINPNKNWLDIEDEYFSSSDQIMYIDDFLSDEALIELREFSLASKVWNKIYQNKYLGAFSGEGFISPIHLQIAIDLKEKLPKLFGPHRIEKFWGFKYDSTLGKGINIHADFALHNLNFWITPDEYNNNKNGGGLKVYDTPAPDNWTFIDYNKNPEKIYDFLKDNNAKCVNVPYKFNRAVLFNSAYFHETDEIDFKDEYVGRRINNTYLFGNRLVKSKN